MSREILVRRWCDNASGHEEPHEVEPDVEPVTLGIDGRPIRALDLCKACRDYLVRPLDELLGDWGQPVEPAAPARQNGRPRIRSGTGERMSNPRVPGRVPVKLAEWTCPECGAVMLMTSGPGHFERRHLAPLGITVPRVPDTCAECGYRNGRPSAMAIHRVARHGYDPRAERVELLAAYRAKPVPAPRKRTRR